jgi:hypothetical protein
VPHNVAVPIPSEALPAQLAAQHPAGSVPGVVDDSTTGKNPWSSSRTRNLLFSLARSKYFGVIVLLLGALFNLCILSPSAP